MAIHPNEWEACLLKWEKLLSKTPDINAILLLVGLQESGLKIRTFSKEQKQDLMHIGLCFLLLSDDFFKLDFVDEDGWPHFTQMAPLPYKNLGEQEQYLKQKIIVYTSENLD